MKLKIVIADDEPGMRLLVRKALEKAEYAELAGEAENGAEAVELVRRLRPDCVFMDVEMPGCDGVQAAKQMSEIDPGIKVVFITAFTDYMPQAFELYVYDYMVKPFKLERLLETVEKIYRLKQSPQKKSGSRLSFKTKAGVVFLDPDDVFIVQREGRQTVIITAADRHYVADGMGEIEELLPKDRFLRSHKSYIINKTKIKKITPYGRWTYIVEFTGIKDDALLTSEKEKELR